MSLVQECILRCQGDVDVSCILCFLIRGKYGVACSRSSAVMCAVVDAGSRLHLMNKVLGLECAGHNGGVDGSLATLIFFTFLLLVGSSRLTVCVSVGLFVGI